MSIAPFALRLFRITAVVLPVTAGMAQGSEFLLQTDQMARCASAYGGEYPINAIGVFKVAALAAPWLIIAICQFTGTSRKVGLYDLWRLLVVLLALFCLLVSAAAFIPTGDGLYCGLWSWRQSGDNEVTLLMLAYIGAVLSLLFALVFQFVVKRRTAAGHWRASQ